MMSTIQTKSKKNGNWDTRSSFTFKSSQEMIS